MSMIGSRPWLRISEDLTVRYHEPIHRYINTARLRIPPGRMDIVVKSYLEVTHLFTIAPSKALSHYETVGL